MPAVFSTKQEFRRVVRCALPLCWTIVFIWSLVALGCKGGHTLNGIHLTGTITTLGTNAATLPNILITITETGEADQTDAAGYFEIRSSTFASEIELHVTGNGIDQSVTIEGISDTAEDVDVILGVDPLTRQVTVVAAYQTPELDGTPTPLPTDGSGEPSPTGTPPPNTTPSATRTPAPSPTRSGPFDSNGNTSSFGIPSGMKGNVRKGGAVWNRKCSSCHSSLKRGRSYGQIRASLKSVPQMRSLSLSAQETADVTAYLNK